MALDKIYWVTRADDAGSCQSANVGMLESCTRGVARNVSIMVPGNAFENAAEMFRAVKGVNLGLHVTLNAEWGEVKWRPMLPRDTVPALVDEKGFFTISPMVLHERQAPVEQMLAEVEAQLATARKAGLNIAYLDQHMGVGWVSGLHVALSDLCRRQGILDADALGLPSVDFGREGDFTANAIDALRQLTPGVYRTIFHPVVNDEEARRTLRAAGSDHDDAANRDADRLLLCDPRLKTACEELNIRVATFDEAAKAVAEMSPAPAPSSPAI